MEIGAVLSPACLASWEILTAQLDPNEMDRVLDGQELSNHSNLEISIGFYIIERSEARAYSVIEWWLECGGDVDATIQDIMDFYNEADEMVIEGGPPVETSGSTG
jgi:hypothetical protein